MTTKEYLEQPYKLKKKLGYLYMELEHYETLMYSVSTIQFDSIRVDKSPAKETINQYALEKYDETKRKINDVELEYNRVVKEIEETIDKLENDNYKSLLKYRYLNEMNMVEIAEKLFTSRTTLHRWLYDSFEKIKALKCFD